MSKILRALILKSPVSMSLHALCPWDFLGRLSRPFNAQGIHMTPVNFSHMVHSAIQVEVTTPEEHMGDVIGDLNSRRGMVGEFVDKVCLLSCPVFSVSM